MAIKTLHSFKSTLCLKNTCCRTFCNNFINC